MVGADDVAQITERALADLHENRDVHGRPQDCATLLAYTKPAKLVDPCGHMACLPNWTVHVKGCELLPKSGVEGSNATSAKATGTSRREDWRRADGDIYGLASQHAVRKMRRGLPPQGKCPTIVNGD
jgi:hypothetical protein